MIRGKRIIITGATGGVGKILAKKLYEHKANLLLISKSKDKLENLTKSLTVGYTSRPVKFLAVDFNNLEEVEKATIKIKKIFNERIDVLINAAGIGYHGKIETIDQKELEQVFNVNVISNIIITSRLLKSISKSGHVINVSSILGSRPMMRGASYVATKHALSGFSKVLRMEAAQKSIKVTTIEPGAIDTSFIERTHEKEAVRYFAKRKLKKLTPEIVADWIIMAIQSKSQVCPELIQIMPQDQII